jgi:uncharacterized protein (UPF0548 family)
MFFLTKPSSSLIHSFLSSQKSAEFPCAEPGPELLPVPRGFVVDRNQIRIGKGERDFARAIEALRRWEMFRLGWIELFPSEAPIAAGTIVGVLAHQLGFWSLNACRIARVIDDHDSRRRFGFVYGTLAAHAERGFEQFNVEWVRESDAVVYSISAYSRPNHPLVWLGYPIVRSLQKRFARDSMVAMFRAIDGAGAR